MSLRHALLGMLDGIPTHGYAEALVRYTGLVAASGRGRVHARAGWLQRILDGARDDAGAGSA